MEAFVLGLCSVTSVYVTVLVPPRTQTGLHDAIDSYVKEECILGIKPYNAVCLGRIKTLKLHTFGKCKVVGVEALW